MQKKDDKMIYFVVTFMEIIFGKYEGEEQKEMCGQLAAS